MTTCSGRPSRTVKKDPLLHWCRAPGIIKVSPLILSRNGLDGTKSAILKKREIYLSAKSPKHGKDSGHTSQAGYDGHITGGAGP